MLVSVNRATKMNIKCDCLNVLRRIPKRLKILTLLLWSYVTLVYMHSKVHHKTVSIKSYENRDVQFMSDPYNHREIIQQYYGKRENWTTSNLGSILFKNHNTSQYTRQDTKKIFKILIWKRFKFLSARHVVGYDGLRKDPFEDCSVNNCLLVGEDEHLPTADAVVVHLHVGLIPSQEHRKPQQRWIFLTDESPLFTFSLSSKKMKWEQLAGVFNWSMTYRSDSDIPVPYGRTIPLDSPKIFNIEDLKGIIPWWNDKILEHPAAILMSNCASSRKEILKRLKKYMPFDGYGKCFEKSKGKCPGGFRKDCPILRQYLFYFSFENSHCDEYLTEKIFYNAFENGAIPVIFGPSLKNCRTLLPPHSYLHVAEFSTLEALARKIKSLMSNVNKLLEYHMWRVHFDLVNEHGYFNSKSQHYCRVCEALNYNSIEPKVYEEEQLSNFLSSNKLCKKYYVLKDLH